MSRLREDQVRRYSRQIILPEVGGAGQKRLLAARALVVGAGGLGSPVIMYLAAAGIGTIHVIDDDAVDLTNLQRQVLHTTPRVGMPKAESARLAAAELNPDVRIVPHTTRLTRANALELFAAADVVLDGSDNFPTRYLVNDACHFAGKPLVSGAILRFEGQVAVFPHQRGGDAPCYRCLFPEAPPPGLVPTCREAGVLGAMAGVIGSMQAVEAIKVLLGIGEPLAGRLVAYDALRGSFRELRVKRDRGCALCGDAPAITGLPEDAEGAGRCDG
jgi:adenylyltransferase/sulfurtransferase